MKKVVALVALLIAMTVMLSACGNYQYFDTQFSFNRAQIKLQDGTVVSGAVEKWRDYEDGDQVQVTIDGITYLVHIANCTLID